MKLIKKERLENMYKSNLSPFSCGSKSGQGSGLIVLLIIIIIALFILMPHALIWAVNCLVASGGVEGFLIGHTLKDWFCALVIMAAIGGSSNARSK